MFAELTSMPMASPADTAEYRCAMWLLNGMHAAQYLLSHTRSRMNGAVKAEQHRAMCVNYVATLKGVEPDAVYREPWLYDAIHDTTADELTNHLGKAIGFNPDAHVSGEMIEKFFSAFHRIAVRAAAEFAVSPLAEPKSRPGRGG